MTEAELHRRIERRAPDYLEWLQVLVACPSPTGQEGPCQLLVEERMRRLGLQPQRVYAQPGPPYHPTGRDYSERPNVVGYLPGSGAERILLNAHIDTAPVEDPATWTYPPYAAVLEQGKLHGRGSLDDKAGVAMMLLLAEVFSDLPRQPSLYFASVIEDEDSGNGTLACTLAGYWCDRAIILDGSWPFRALDSHLGQLWFEFVVQGQAVAACSQHRGQNPILLAQQKLQLLQNWITQQNALQPQWLEVSPAFFLNPGLFHSGNWPGAVPETARVGLQVGFPPPWNPETIRVEIEALIGPITVGSLATAPHSQRPNAMAQRLQANVQRLRPQGLEFKIQAVSGHCDLRHLKRRDGSQAQACLYGPGGGGNPHVANEFYLVDDFVPVAQNLASTLLEFL